MYLTYVNKGHFEVFSIPLIIITYWPLIALLRTWMENFDKRINILLHRKHHLLKLGISNIFLGF